MEAACVFVELLCSKVAWLTSFVYASVSFIYRATVECSAVPAF